MRKWLWVPVVLLLFGTAYAELQTVQVGGVLETRFRYIPDTFNKGTVGFGPSPEIRGPAAWFPHRAIGNPLGVVGALNWSDQTNTWAFAELATSVNVKADFSDDITSFIEFYSFDIWGQDFRSQAYTTGVDARAVTNDDIEVLQSYIETRETFGLPIRLRIGRQSLQFGKNFLVAEKTTPTQRIAFDAVRLTYQQDKLTIDAWWSKLAELSPIEEDGDVDFYGVYGTYQFAEAFNASAYWMLVRDARKQFDFQRNIVGEWVEDVVGLDDYDPTMLHTVGTRLWGKVGALDYNLEGAYQFGDASSVGVNFKKPSIWGRYGDDDADWDNWAVDGEVGYLLDIAWKPRLFVGGAYFSGEDNRDVSFLEWLNPLDRPEASTSFNRLFSDVNYAPVLQDNGEMSNFSQVRGGVTFTPTEKVWVMVRLMNLWANGTFDWPANWRFGHYRFPLAPGLGFWTEESDDNMGFHADTVIRYTYNSNLTFVVYYGHLFAGEAVKDGNYVLGFGNQFHGGIAKEDADYAFFWTILKF